jgi:hypothetical protein
MMIQSVEEFAVLVYVHDSAVRDAAVDAAVWMRLLEAGFPKSSVLLNKRLPLEVLVTLANDPSPEIRCRVADKRAAAPLLAKLAEDPDEGVRVRVAYNAKTPHTLLRRLVRDPVVQVANAARRRLALPVDEEPDITDVIEPAYNSFGEPALTCGAEIWAKPGGAIMLRAADGEDPLELDTQEARKIARALLELAGSEETDTA